MQVVVDGELGATDLDVGTVSGIGRAAFETDQLELVRLAASSSRASSSATTRRANRWPSATISRILASSRSRSSGVNGRATSKS